QRTALGALKPLLRQVLDIDNGAHERTPQSTSRGLSVEWALPSKSPKTCSTFNSRPARMEQISSSG
ncbi:MAG: hypothetical protein VX496_01865, partial [Planctomycetota bacterium]|nr:hypothetical protein [Planctomycetota bacterium]